MVREVMRYLLVALGGLWGWEGIATATVLLFFHVLLLQQFRARGRGWGRGNFSGNNNSNSGGNNDFQKRSRDEEWDPEYTPKSKKYYLHDDREGEGADKWVNRGRGRGAFPRGRGRFMFRKSSTSPKWAHDKFSGEEGEIEDDESGTENREEKDNLQTAAE